MDNDSKPNALFNSKFKNRNFVLESEREWEWDMRCSERMRWDDLERDSERERHTDKIE